MKRRAAYSRRSVLTGLAAVGLGLGKAPAAHATTTLLFVHGEDRRPMSWIGADGEAQGLKIEILDLLLGEAGIRARHQCLPWARAVQSVYSGEADGLLSVTSPERRRWIKFADTPLIEDEARLYYRRDHPRAAQLAAIRRMEDLNAFKLSDALAGPWSAVNAPNLPLDLVPNQPIAFRKMLNRRTDIAIINELAALALVRAEQAEGEVAYVKAPVNSVTRYYIGLRASLPESGGLVTQLDEIARRPQMREALSSLCAKYRRVT
jgi:ABC-type amino acid transport substrate-binding protein